MGPPRRTLGSGIFTPIAAPRQANRSTPQLIVDRRGKGGGPADTGTARKGGHAPASRGLGLPLLSVRRLRILVRTAEPAPSTDR